MVWEGFSHLRNSGIPADFYLPIIPKASLEKKIHYYPCFEFMDNTRHCPFKIGIKIPHLNPKLRWKTPFQIWKIFQLCLFIYLFSSLQPQAPHGSGAPWIGSSRNRGILRAGIFCASSWKGFLWDLFDFPPSGGSKIP